LPLVRQGGAEVKRRPVDLQHEGRAELLAQVAELYYLRGRDQSAIAEEVGTSRSNVSRLLTEARRKGIVEIRIHRPLGRARTLEDDLTARFRLKDARVLATAPRTTAHESLRRVGALAAGYLSDNLRDGLMIGLSWGTLLEAMVEAVFPPRAYEVEVIQLLGGLSWVSPALSGHELGRDLADRLGGRFSYLHAPAIVESPEVRNALLRQQGIAEVLRRGERSDIAFVGVGSLGVGSSAELFSEAGVTGAERKEMKASGAVGDVCARLFTITGERCDVEVDRRVVGIELEGLRSIPRVVGVARGLEKGPGILGALRGGFVNVLITDEPAAIEVMRLAAEGESAL
jgi:DNA-binding transcriptional regulator LsrR (DeoR family)